MMHLKRFLKKLLFDINAKNFGVVNFLYRWTFNPKKGSLADFMFRFSLANPRVRFIQVGANDGYYHDPVHRFIRMFRWEGVLLEPQPDVYEQYLCKLHAFTPNVQTVNAALSYEDGKCEMFKIAFSSSRWATGLTSFKRDAVEKAIQSGHVERLANRYGEKLPKDKRDYIEKVVIDSISASTLIDTYDLKKVDWVQIDAEGFDFEIIKLLKIDCIKPTVIVYEKSHLSDKEQEACIMYLRENNYEVTDIRENTVAMRNPTPAFAAFFARNNA